MGALLLGTESKCWESNNWSFGAWGKEGSKTIAVWSSLDCFLIASFIIYQLENLMWKIMLQLQTHSCLLKKRSPVAEVAVRFIIQIKEPWVIPFIRFPPVFDGHPHLFWQILPCKYSLLVCVFHFLPHAWESGFLWHRSGPCSPIETLLSHRDKCCCCHLISSQGLGLELLAWLRNWEGFLWAAEQGRTSLGIF